MADVFAGAVKAQPASELERHRALLEIAEAISVHRDLPALFHSLADLLHKVVQFDAIYLVLHDEERQMMRLHILVSEDDTASTPQLELPVEDSPGGMVWQTQQPVIFSGEEMVARFPQVKDVTSQHRVRSVCILPLSSAHRRLGAIGFASAQPEIYDLEDVTFLEQAARQVAVAVDNALNGARAQTYQRQLARERDRLQVLLEMTNAVVSTLDLRGLFPVISACLRRVVNHDYASLALLDADGQHLRLYALDFPGGRGYVQEQMAGRVDEIPPGRAVQSHKPYVIRAGEAGFGICSEIASLHRTEGLKCAVFLPLISRDRVLGTLNVASRHVDAFPAADIELLTSAASQFAIAVENAVAYREIAELKDKLAEEKLYLEDEIRTEYNFEEIIGESVALKRALKDVETVAPTESSVLVLGETGTGKELIARAIHQLSPRKERTFVKINCAAIPSGLLESELFGHERGAFTGAIAQKVGRFELAHHGTLFLDEIGDIPLELQPKLLRVLQEHEFERLGSTKTTQVDVRLVAATNQDLARMVEERLFRSDLYYRLNVFPIQVPPLRDRASDIPLLVRYFAQKYARRMNKRIETVPAEAFEALVNYSWPGNVRELENLVERAVILTQGSVLYVPLAELQSSGSGAASGVGILPVTGHGRVLFRDSDGVPRTPAIGDASAPVPPVQTLEEAERDHILRVLRECDWVVGGPGGAAVRLGMKRTTLQSKMRKLNISRPQ